MCQVQQNAYLFGWILLRKHPAQQQQKPAGQVRHVSAKTAVRVLHASRRSEIGNVWWGGMPVVCGLVWVCGGMCVFSSIAPERTHTSQRSVSLCQGHVTAFRRSSKLPDYCGVILSSEATVCEKRESGRQGGGTRERGEDDTSYTSYDGRVYVLLCSCAPSLDTSTRL